MDVFSFLQQHVQQLTTGYNRVYNLAGSSAALLLALETRPFVAAEKDEDRAQALFRDITFYRQLWEASRPVYLPDSNGPLRSGTRALISYSLKPGDSLVTSANNLCSGFWDRESLENRIVLIRRGSVLSRDSLDTILIGLGYRQAPMVVEAGEYSRRGWLVDIFPSTEAGPVRVEFFGDEIEQIRRFDIETQMSTEVIEQLSIFPAAEPEEQRYLSRSLGEGRRFYCLYAAESLDGLPPETVFLSRYPFEIDAVSEDVPEGDARSAHQRDAGMLSMKGMGILPEDRKGLDEFPPTIEKLSRRRRVILVASSEGQSERLKDIFREHEIIVPSVDIKDLIGFQGRLSLTVGKLSSGLCLDGLMILTEREIFGERPSYRPIVKSKVSGLIFSMDDITPGDFVVHREHGIGRFSGVTRQTVDESELELMTLEYEDGRLYIPVQNIQNISKFRSEEGVLPKVDRLGGKTWQKKKERARRKIHEMASMLLTLYAKRKVSRGFTFSPDVELHREFDSFFAYEETLDQAKAIDAIKRDMESDRPMDRLLCGDVGYGKTEVAMRAAFKAVYDSRQVAVLVPTTILAEQHYRTFRERFSGFPITIDFISRFKSQKEIRATLKSVSEGRVDIIIGTHGLLSRKIVFNRLGLLVVDEEHRFGVGQKERIKEMSRDVDVLTLTATPIPRTLHMALSGIRDISVIETPPEERLSVKSVVTMFNDKLVQDAINIELQRNGQVYFVHNRIQDIFRIAHRIKEILPHAEIGVAHGQMPEKELEEAMHRFFAGEINVLVSTAIIGAGLDIPRANTIIINRAEKMGLADLYQLRGRVGRSNLKAYAFFLSPPEPLLTEEAKKRLQAVQEMSYLGAGFRLALKDLEIRGAGNIFGPEQSGRIHEIGFDLYIEMLEKAVAELQGIDIKEEVDPVIDLRVSAFIPDKYIEDITLRLSFYRRIASLKNDTAVLDLGSELRDRFGNLPDEVRNLMEIMRLKIRARELLITRVQESGGAVKVLFSPDTPVQPDHIFGLQHKRTGMIKFLPEGFELRPQGQKKAVFQEVFNAMEELRSCVSTPAS